MARQKDTENLAPESKPRQHQHRFVQVGKSPTKQCGCGMWADTYDQIQNHLRRALALGWDRQMPRDLGHDRGSM